MWPNSQETADLVTFTGEILNGVYTKCEEQKIVLNQGRGRVK